MSNPQAAHPRAITERKGFPQLVIEITEYPEMRPLPHPAEAERIAKQFEEWLKRRKEAKAV
jgi:hypothetical protein